MHLDLENEKKVTKICGFFMLDQLLNVFKMVRNLVNSEMSLNTDFIVKVLPEKKSAKMTKIV